VGCKIIFNRVVSGKIISRRGNNFWRARKYFRFGLKTTETLEPKLTSLREAQDEIKHSAMVIRSHGSERSIGMRFDKVETITLVRRTIVRRDQ
jgi:hypothetical protein